MLITDQITSDNNGWNITASIVREVIDIGLGHFGLGILSPIIHWISDTIIDRNRVTVSESIHVHDKYTGYDPGTFWVCEADFSKEDVDKFEYPLNRVYGLFILEGEGGKTKFNLTPYGNKDFILIADEYGVDHADQLFLPQHVDNLLFSPDRIIVKAHWEFDQDWRWFAADGFGLIRPTVAFRMPFDPYVKNINTKIRAYCSLQFCSEQILFPPEAQLFAEKFSIDLEPLNSNQIPSETTLKGLELDDAENSDSDIDVSALEEQAEVWSLE